MTGIRICIDPGHGGTESDDRYLEYAGFYESASNLTKGLELREILQNLGADVKMTRTGNNDPPPVEETWEPSKPDDPRLSERVAIANGFNADYFQSIHSNGWRGTSNYTLVLFQGFDDDPTYSGSKVIADILAPNIRAANRTLYHSNPVRGDFDFYGTGGPYLGVFRGLNMFHTLTEGSFHDYVPETWRLMNLDYRKNEARAIARSIVQYYGQGGFSTGSLAGIVRDREVFADWSALSGTGDQRKPIDQFRVSIQPGNIEYAGDTNKNGYFCVDSLAPGSYTVIAEALDHHSDTILVEVTANKTNFADFSLLSNTPPYVILSYPIEGANPFPAWEDLLFKFSRSMNTLSVENAFSLDPAQPGTFDWSSDKKILRFTPSDTLEFLTNYSINITGSATDSYGVPLDGDGDGVGGDTWTIRFTTGREDMTAPTIVNTYPSNTQKGISQKPVLTVVYNEHLLPASVNDDLFVVLHPATSKVISSTAEMHFWGEKTVVSIFPTDLLNPNDLYQLRLKPGLKDLSDNEITYTRFINFETADEFYTKIKIDNFDGDFTSYWQPAKTSSYTTGIITEGSQLSADQTYRLINRNSQTSMRIDYQWDPAASNWLIHHQLLGGPAAQVTFSDDYKLQAFIYGDGGGNTFRFAVGESNNGIEVSPWYTLDWLGWRLVSWDMRNDGTGTWIGDGAFSLPMYVEGLQFSHEAGAELSGTIYVDDLRLAILNTTPVEAESSQTPSTYAIRPNYPNPFNPVTNIPFQLPEESNIHISIYDMKGKLVETVFSGKLLAGQHLTRWDAASQSSGIYLLVMETEHQTLSRKITVLK